MKLNYNKALTSGKYQVSIGLSFNSFEVEQMKKFGAPTISISPQQTLIKNSLGSWELVRNLAIHDLNNRQFVFSEEEKAIGFLDTLTERIKHAMEELRNKVDTFSGNQPIDI